MPGYLANMMARLGLDAGDFNTNLSKAERSFQNFGRNLQQAGQAMTLSITAPLAGVAVMAVKASADMQSLRMALDTITGSSAESATQLGRLKEVAKLPGLGFQEAVQGSINLQAAGFAALDAERALKAFGNALATVGKGRADLEGVNLVLTQIVNKPKVMAQDLNQLRERLPQISQAMKAAFGSNVSEDIQKLGISGQQFVEEMIRQFEKLPPVTGGFKNSIENLKDSLFLAAVEMGDALLPLAQKIADFAAGSVEKIKGLVGAFKELPEPIQNVTIGVTGLAAAFPVLVFALGTTITNLGVITQALGGLSGVVGKLTTGIQLLSRVFVPVAAAMAVYWGGNKLLEYSQGLDKTSDSLGKLNEKFKAFPTKTTAGTFNLTLGEDTGKTTKTMDSVLDFLNTKIPAAAETTNKSLGKTSANVKKAAEEIHAFVGPIEDAFSRMLREEEANRHAAALRRVVDTVIDFQQISTVAGKKLETLWSDQSQLVKDFRLEMLLTAPVVAQMAEVDPRIFEEQMERLKNANKNATQTIKRDRYDLGRELEYLSHRTFDALGRDLARNIVNWQSWSETIKNVGKGFAEDFLSIMFKALFKPLEDQFAKLAGKIGDWLGGLLGGGSSAAGAATTAAGGAATIGTGAAGGASGAVGAVSSGLMGIVGAVGSAVSAVSGVIGNFQFAGMNKSLDIIVNHTLVTANELTNLRRDAWDRHSGLFLKLDDLWSSIRDVSSAIHGAGGAVNAKQAIQITVNLDSKTIWSGMANTAQLQGI